MTDQKYSSSSNRKPQKGRIRAASYEMITAINRSFERQARRGKQRDRDEGR